MAEPWTPEEITADWLTGVLAAAGVLDGSRVVECDLGPLPGSPSFTGRFRRLVPVYDPPDPGAPRSLVAKFSTADAAVRETVSGMGFYARESAFYRRLGATAPVGVPRCFYSAVSADTGDSLLLLEDLSDARRGRSAGECTAADAALAVDTMADLHARWWGAPDLDGHLLDHDSFATTAELVAMFDGFWPVFVGKRSSAVTEAHRAAGSIIAAELAAATEDLFHHGPQTLVHHDFQADNLLFDVAGVPGTMAVIDWQMAVRGRGPIDLAYFLSGSVTAEFRRREEESLVRRYADRLAAAGVTGYGFADAWSDYRRGLVIPPARLAVAVGATGSMQAHPGAFWDVLFDRQVQALADHGLL